jgi:hypothetical protein
MASTPRQDQGKETTPRSFAEVTPRLVTQGHDFILQAVIEMQRSIGELSAKTDRLISDVKSQGEKIDSVRIRLVWVTGGAAVVGFLIATALAALKFLPVWGASASK